MSTLSHAVRIASKDLKIELRSKEIVLTMAFFGGLLAMVYSFVFPSNADLIKLAVPGMLWVSIAFAGTIGPWGYIGILPLATALVGSCPAYTLLGVDTCPTPRR